MAILLTLLAVCVVLSLSWLVTCGIVYLVTLCFGWQFSWLIGTGIWLILGVLRSIFNNK